MTTVCAIQQVPVEGLGLVADVLATHRITVEMIRPFKGDQVPRRLGRHSGLVIMGGPMGVYEQDKHPFLRHEIRLIEDALSEAKPILGICLGSQLLATALGAAVRKGKHKEIGWHQVTLTGAAADDDLWRGCRTKFTAFHWHGDVFELPRGAVSLARSKLTDCQAFRYGASAYGLLFHLEVTASTVGRMAKAFRHELLQEAIDKHQLSDKLPARLESLGQTAVKVLGSWAQLALKPPPQYGRT